MIFAGLLSLRKKFPVWRMGRTSTWMRGHLWLGLISYPIILFHSGFSFGKGTLTWWMMFIFTVVILSGLLGAVLQQYMPKMMTDQIPYETIYAEIPRIRGQLLDEADVKVAEVTGVTINEAAIAASAGDSGGVVVTTVQMEEDVRNELTRFYDHDLRPYLEQAGGKEMPDCRSRTLVGDVRKRAYSPAVGGASGSGGSGEHLRGKTTTRPADAHASRAAWMAADPCAFVFGPADHGSGPRGSSFAVLRKTWPDANAQPRASDSATTSITSNAGDAGAQPAPS